MARQREFTLRLEGVDIGKFQKHEIHTIGQWIISCDEIEGARFEGIWFHVEESGTQTVVHLPRTMIYPVCQGVADVINIRAAAREEEEKAAVILESSLFSYKPDDLEFVKERMNRSPSPYPGDPKIEHGPLIGLDDEDEEELGGLEELKKLGLETND